MIVVADSGSSKTDWRIINGEEIKQLETIGLNPDFHTQESIEKEINDAFIKEEALKVEQVYFYGSGCSSESRKSLLQTGLSALFKNAVIKVEHDLLGAARASCGNQAGLAGILGTGSNCCLFDGANVIREYRSGGYILGDEGGGVAIGKRLIKNYIEDTLPADLREAFDKRYSYTVDDILLNIYKKAQPNRFLASFANFVFHHREHPYITSLLTECFEAYFDVQVLRYPEVTSLSLNLVGSIAFYYHEYIRQVAERKGVRIGTILEKPISGLSLYHSGLATN
jgi:N-acetylglucosamine kinase-like BadF-type ATPase